MRCLLVSLSLLLLGLALVSAVDVDVRLKRQTQRVGVSKECTAAVNTFTSALSSAFPMVQWHNDFGAFIFKDPGWLVSSLYYRYTGSAWEWAVNQNGPFQPVSNRKVSSGIHSYLQPLGLTDISACNKYLMDKLQAANHPKPYAPPAPSDDKGIKALLDQLANAKGESKAAYCVMVRSKIDIKSGKTCCKPDKASTDIHCCATTSGSSTDEHAENGPTPRGMYRMESKRQHPKYGIPWFNLERYQGGKFLGYGTKGTDGRYVFGFHPGQVSHGCVTVQATQGANGYEVGAGTCWSELEKRVDRGMIDVGHRGYMFVF